MMPSYRSSGTDLPIFSKLSQYPPWFKANHRNNRKTSSKQFVGRPSSLPCEAAVVLFFERIRCHFSVSDPILLDLGCVRFHDVVGRTIRGEEQGAETFRVLRASTLLLPFNFVQLSTYARLEE